MKTSEKDYIQWARDNYHSKVGLSGKIKIMWHPTVRREMHRLHTKQLDIIRAKVKEMTRKKSGK